MGENLKGYPKRISKEPGTTVIPSRHSNKETDILESDGVQQQLSPEGRENAREEAEEFFEYILSTVPPGGIVTLSSSTIDRAVETRDIFVETLRELACEQRGILLVRRYRSDGTPRSDEEFLHETKSLHFRYIVIDALADEDLGYRRDENDNVSHFNGAMEFFNDEHFVSMIWAVTPDELPALIQRFISEVEQHSEKPLTKEECDELSGRIALQIGRYLAHNKKTPEELVAHQLEGVERSIVEAFRLRPDRRHVLHLIQHAPGLSFLALVLSGQEISFKNYDALGDYQHYLEAMSYDVDPEGRVLVTNFRTHTSNIEPILIRNVIDTLYQKSELRKEAWKKFFSSPLVEVA